MNVRAIVLIGAVTFGACAQHPDVETLRGALTPGNCGAQILRVTAATASSEQNNGFFSAAKAIDGNLSTRWSSNQGMPQWLDLDMGSTVFVSELDIDWQTAFATTFEVQAGNDGAHFGTVLASGATQAGWQSITGLNVVARHLRILATGATSFGSVSIVETKVIGDTNPSCPTLETACGQSVKVVASKAAASSTQFSYTPAAAAIDQDYGTRWSSNFNDNEWLALDLGSSVRVDGLRIIWEHAFASQYAIQVGPSMSGPWTTVVSATANAFGAQTVPNVNATTQYLRLLGIKRATQYGYSLYELEVYGSRDAGCLLKGPWQFDATDTTMTPNTGFWTVTGNTIAVDFTGKDFTINPVNGAANIGVWFEQPVTVVKGGTYNLDLTVTNSNGLPALFGAQLDGAGPAQGLVDGTSGATFTFTVSADPGSNPLIRLEAAGIFSGPSNVGLSAYTVSASLVKTN
jgi:hypothetical protein